MSKNWWEIGSQSLTENYLSLEKNVRRSSATVTTVQFVEWKAISWFVEQKISILRKRKASRMPFCCSLEILPHLCQRENVHLLWKRQKGALLLESPWRIWPVQAARNNWRSGQTKQREKKKTVWIWLRSVFSDSSGCILFDAQPIHRRMVRRRGTKTALWKECI